MDDKMDDEFAGQGGSYVLDPKTGQRRRVEEPTSEAPAHAQDIPAAPPPPLFPLPLAGEGQGEGQGEGAREDTNVSPLTRRRKPIDEGS